MKLATHRPNEQKMFMTHVLCGQITGFPELCPFKKYIYIYIYSYRESLCFKLLPHFSSHPN